MNIAAAEEEEEVNVGRGRCLARRPSQKRFDRLTRPKKEESWFCRMHPARVPAGGPSSDEMEGDHFHLQLIQRNDTTRMTPPPRPTLPFMTGCRDWVGVSAIPGEEKEKKKKWKMMRMRWRVRPSRRLFLLPYLSSDDEAVTVGLNSTRLKQARKAGARFSNGSRRTCRT